MSNTITIIEHADDSVNDSIDYMITTLDNPFNPFTQWDEWLGFDASKGYHTINYLARIAKNSIELSEPDRVLSVNNAIDEIIKHDILGIYIKVTEKGWKDRSKETVFPTVTIVKA